MPREKPMTQEEYDAIKAASPAYSFSGTIQAYWQPMCCAPMHYHERMMALRLDGGGMIQGFNVSLWVGGPCGAKLPEGTRVTIDVPAGSLGPFSRFCDEAIEFKPQPDESVLWCSEHPKPPETRDDPESYDDEDEGD